jgi:hypothetical protein
MIVASSAYQDNGAIIIWWDETESDGPKDNANDLAHTFGEIVISPLARANNGGVPYASSVDFTHSSDLRIGRNSSIYNLSSVTLLTLTIFPTCSRLAPSRRGRI